MVKTELTAEELRLVIDSLELRIETLHKRQKEFSSPMIRERLKDKEEAIETIVEKLIVSLL